MTFLTNRLPVLGVFFLAAALSACGGGGGKKFDSVTVKETDVTPVIANSELVLGPNRFVVGFVTSEGDTLVDAKVHEKFYDLTAGTEAPRFELDAVSRVPARDAGLPPEVEHTLPDGTTHVQSNVGEDVGVYTSNVTFDTAGTWGVEISVDSPKPKVKTTMRVRFDVLAESSTPAVGSAAPKTKNLTLADVKDITTIDSSPTPTASLHMTTIAQAIATHSPALVLFAVPGYCSSRFCGPEYEIMRKLQPKYQGKAEFIHVEFYKDPTAVDREPVDAVKEWNLRTEPWFFVIDSNGIITAKFEGPTSMQELDQALQAVVH